MKSINSSTLTVAQSIVNVSPSQHDDRHKSTKPKTRKLHRGGNSRLQQSSIVSSNATLGEVKGTKAKTHFSVAAGKGEEVVANDDSSL